MVAVLRQEVVRSPEKFFRGLLYGFPNLLICGQSESMENLALERSTWRLGLGLGPVNSSQTTLIVSSIRIFATVYNDTRMKERGSDRP